MQASLLYYTKTIENLQDKGFVLNPYDPCVANKTRKQSADILSFEHININGIGRHDNMIEMTNIMGILRNLQAGVFSINEHSLNTSNPTLLKKFYEIMIKKLIFI